MKGEEDFMPTIVINGTLVSAEALISVFLMVFDPNPNNWYRFEKRGGTIMIETKPVEGLVQ